MLESRLEYRIKIIEQAPKLSEEAIGLHQKCYLGISLNNPIFWDDAFKHILSWAAGRFEHCRIVVADYLHRHNEQIMYGKTGAESIQAALALGDEYLNQMESFLAKFPKDQFEVLRWQPLLEKNAYQKEEAKLQLLYKQNTAFGHAINRSAEAFVARQTAQGRSLQVSDNEAVRLSVAYLLEEMAVFSLLVGEGWGLELYPGSQLSVLTQIAKGKFPDAPEALKKRVFWGLRAIKR